MGLSAGRGLGRRDLREIRIIRKKTQRHKRKEKFAASSSAYWCLCLFTVWLTEQDALLALDPSLYRGVATPALFCVAQRNSPQVSVPVHDLKFPLGPAGSTLFYFFFADFQMCK